MLLQNVRIRDNGAAFMIEVDGLIVTGFSTLGDAWNHIAWMHVVASQEFTVGEKLVPVKDWIEGMTKAGYLDKNAGYKS